MSERSTAESAQKIPINATFMISSNYSQRSSAPCPQSIPLPSALATARIINDIGRIAYPDGIRSPKGELNANAKDGKFIYDRDFLLQFMSVCKEKPDMLPPLDSIGLEPSYPCHTMSRSSFGSGIGSFGKAVAQSPLSMGNFALPSDGKLSSEERFALQRAVSSNNNGSPFVPRQSSKIVIKSQDGTEIDISKLMKEQKLIRKEVEKEGAEVERVVGAKRKEEHERASKQEKGHILTEEESKRVKKKEKTKADVDATFTNQEGVVEKQRKAVKDSLTDTRDQRKDRPKDNENPRVDTSSASPSAADPPINSKPTPLAPSSAFAKARLIDDIGQIIYPEGIKGPKMEPNINAKDGKFIYDRDFMLQFRSICKEKPDMLPPLDTFGLLPTGQRNLATPRSAGSRRRSAMSNVRAVSIASGTHAKPG